MKKNTFILIFLFCIAAVKGQEPSITMTTAKAIGETVSFSLAASADNTTIQIDFGDNTKVDKIIGTSTIDISSTLVGSQTIKIYGQGIELIACINNQLTILDITNNSALKYLDCRYNQLTTLVVSNKPALRYLFCQWNQLKTLVVSNNPALTELYCSINQLISLDVTHNTALKYLECGVNQLTTLDVSTNPALELLVCSFNQLTTLVLNNSLLRILCGQNQFTLATLPLPQDSWIVYAYAPQNPIFIGTEVNVGDETDLSSQLTVNGSTTVYTWKTKDGTTLTDGVDYTITNGKTVFLKSQADSVYCEMSNATFPGFTGNNALKTSNVKVLGTTSLEPDKFKDNGLYIYPNPANNIINVEGIDLQNANLSIYNALGKLILQQKTGNGNTQVNIGHLPKGVYMLQITNGTRKIVRKIIRE